MGVIDGLEGIFTAIMAIFFLLVLFASAAVFLMWGAAFVYSFGTGVQYANAHGSNEVSNLSESLRQQREANRICIERCEEDSNCIDICDFYQSLIENCNNDRKCIKICEKERSCRMSCEYFVNRCKKESYNTLGSINCQNTYINCVEGCDS